MLTPLSSTFCRRRLTDVSLIFRYSSLESRSYKIRTSHFLCKATARSHQSIPPRSSRTSHSLAFQMVQRAMHFTPKVLLSAPRRSAGVPNPAGTLVLYTVSTYSFESHKKTNELRALDIKTGESHELAKNDDISDLNWLDNDNFTCLQAEKDGTTSVYVASVSEVCLAQCICMTRKTDEL